MSKRHLYVLAFAIIALASAAIYYKRAVLKFPLQPDTTEQVWTVQAHVEYQPRKGGNTVTLQLPQEPVPGYTLLDQRYVARDYSKLEETDEDGREVQWAIRRAYGEQDLYYRVTIVRAAGARAELAYEPTLPLPPVLEEPYSTAALTLLEDVRLRSSNIVTYARELARRFADDQPGEEVALLRERFEDDDTSRTQFLAGLLAI